MDCSICYDYLDMTKQELISNTLPCGHIFHITCLNIWLEKKWSCPYCKKMIDFDYNNKTLAKSEDFNLTKNEITKIIIEIDEKYKNHVSKEVRFNDCMIKYKINTKIGLLFKNDRSFYTITFYYKERLYECIIKDLKSNRLYTNLDVKVNDCLKFKITYLKKVIY